MAIRVPNLGLGDGKTGDTELKIRQDYNHNFSDQTNAASRLVGPAAGQIPLAQDTRKAATGLLTGNAVGPTFDCNNFEGGTSFYVEYSTLNSPPIGSAIITTEGQSSSSYTAYRTQEAINWGGVVRMTRTFSESWSPWVAHNSNPLTYSTTTAAGANTVTDATGKLMRSTSSERYKEILAPLELDDAKYADAMALKPIVYRSTAEADNPLHHFYSFSAEELGAYDPAFTLWRTTEMVTDAEGDTAEQPLAERQAEGININALLAMSHAIAIKQDKLIKNLQKQIDALKPPSEV